ncbi:MAG: TetR/AcrR family transcriptional regulator [Streptosporangiaceae bacterium]
MTEPGLRERKKQATRRALRKAALRLALERGTEGLTVEEISAVADVSPRTFFNYFSCKEDALVGEDPEADAEVAEAIRARPAAESPLRSMRVVLKEIAAMHSAHANRDDMLARQRLVRENPSLLPRQLARYAAFERTLAQAVAERIGVDGERDPYPSLLAAVAVTMVRVAMHRWTTERGRGPEEYLDEAFDLLERGL